MSQKILGLDIGSYSIKGALFDTTFRSFELTDLFESTPLKADDLPPEDRTVVATEALLRLIHENSLSPSTVVTALAGMVVSTRILQLPLSSRQVEKVLPFELEAEIPFELDEIIVDHHEISAHKGQTLVLAAAARKTSIAEHLAILRGAHLDPAVVGLDSLYLYNLHQMTLASDEGTYAIIDIGHQKTSVCIISAHKVAYIRTLLTGGRAVTEAIRTELDLTLDQAVEVKHDHGILELDGKPLQSKDLRRLSTAARKAIDPLIREITQTIHSFRAQFASLEQNVSNVERIYLAGGTSLLRNLPEYMTGLLAMPVTRLRFFPEHHEVSQRLGARESILAQAVSLGLRAAARGKRVKEVAAVNFRKNEFAFARDLSDIKEKAFFFGRWAVALFLVALVHVVFRYQNLSRQYARHEQVVMQAFNRIVTDVPTPPKNSTVALRLLQERILQYRQKQEILTAGLKDLTALGVLKDLSERIPNEVPIDTQELAIDRNLITLRAYTDSFSSVDKIIAALHGNPAYRRIEKGEMRDAPDGKKSFVLTISVGEEESPGGGKRK